MRTHKFATTIIAVLACAVAAYASPIFGTWKGELNGHPITVSVTYSEHQASATMTSDGRNVAVSNAGFPKGVPPLTLQFQAANQEGKTRLVSTASSDLSFELSTTDGRDGLLRVMDQGKIVATVKMTKVDATK